MSTYKPGTVAVATVRGVPNVRVFHYEYDGVRGWCSDVPVSGGTDHAPALVTDIRPLVVLDLDDPNLYGCSAVAHDPAKIVAALMGTNSVAAHGIARQIEQQTRPPRISEPGLWGVVEAHPRTKGTRPVRFVRDSMSADEPWVAIADGSAWDWDDLIDPTLVRDGIEATS